MKKEFVKQEHSERERERRKEKWKLRPAKLSAHPKSNKNVQPCRRRAASPQKDGSVMDAKSNRRRRTDRQPSGKGEETVIILSQLLLLCVGRALTTLVYTFNHYLFCIWESLSACGSQRDFAFRYPAPITVVLSKLFFVCLFVCLFGWLVHKGPIVALVNGVWRRSIFFLVLGFVLLFGFHLFFSFRFFIPRVLLPG